ncbi:type II toxin-antitoxin system VapB family antitoxin [Endozoicomonas sp. Mp262]|uniref:type II toxin-antitoxin system VapB family antitoxin n=1 Tax=Endozoicomonas sp. Mp262 TaxID=2919499 RepID=UPI0021DB1B8B
MLYTLNFKKKVYTIPSIIRTNIVIDQDLVNEALSLSGLGSRRELIHHALEELVRRKKQQQLLELQGKISWEGDLDQSRDHS